MTEPLPEISLAEVAASNASMIAQIAREVAFGGFPTADCLFDPAIPADQIGLFHLRKPHVAPGPNFIVASHSDFVRHLLPAGLGEDLSETEGGPRFAIVPYVEKISRYLATKLGQERAEAVTGLRMAMTAHVKALEKLCADQPSIYRALIEMRLLEVERLIFDAKLVLELRGLVRRHIIFMLLHGTKVVAQAAFASQHDFMPILGVNDPKATKAGRFLGETARVAEVTRDFLSPSANADTLLKYLDIPAVALAAKLALPIIAALPPPGSAPPANDADGSAWGGLVEAALKAMNNPVSVSAQGISNLLATGELPTGLPVMPDAGGLGHTPLLTAQFGVSPPEAAALAAVTFVQMVDAIPDELSADGNWRSMCPSGPLPLTHGSIEIAESLCVVLRATTVRDKDSLPKVRAASGVGSPDDAVMMGENASRGVVKEAIATLRDPGDKRLETFLVGAAHWFST